MRALRPSALDVLRNHGPLPLKMEARRLGPCIACRTRALSRMNDSVSVRSVSRIYRSFSTTSLLLEDKNLDKARPSKESGSSPSPAVRTVPDEELPSHREKTRYNISRKTHAFLDDLMQRLAVAGQEINNYTGTDYTGIDALRREIKEQEQLVKARRDEVQKAKAEFEAADSQRAASQKEVVGLLERKSSWTSTDLERYMALIRSEHANDQAVQVAKDAVSSTEQALEYARARLEKRERDQYHEEQIWSDTIRRNSTWVTFGLMGVNILILLVNLMAIEPWRRKRLVKEFREALDEKTTPLQSNLSETERAVVTTPVLIESIIEPIDIAKADSTETETVVDTSPSVPAEMTLEGAKSYIEGLFSNREISLTRVELTMAVIQATIVGATLAGSLAFALRPR